MKWKLLGFGNWGDSLISVWILLREFFGKGDLSF